MPRLVRTLGGLVALLAMGGCRDLDRFDTKGAEAYCGGIVRAQFVRTREVEGGFGRTTQLQLELDTDALTTRPGRLLSNDADRNECAPKPTFDNAPLISVPEVIHDRLSSLIFDEGQVHNLVAWVESCRGPMLAIVSLLKSGDVEVRVLSPPPVESMREPNEDSVDGGEPAQTSRKRAAFALFQLQRSSTPCGF